MCLDNEFIVFFELGRLLLNSNFMKPWGFSYQLKGRTECRAGRNLLLAVCPL